MTTREYFKAYPKHRTNAHITPYYGEYLVQVYSEKPNVRMIQVIKPTLQAARYEARAIATR